MRSRKRQLCVACAHAGGRATVGRGEGAGERAATGEAGAERAEVEAEGPWGGRAGLCHLGLSRQFLPAHKRSTKTTLSARRCRKACVYAACPGAMAAEGSGVSGRGSPSPPSSAEPQPFQPASTAFTAVFCSARLAGATPSCLCRPRCRCALWVRGTRGVVAV